MLNIALLQMTSHGFDQAANLTTGERFCRQAHSQGADIALFPEMWNIGYQSFDPDTPGAFEAWRDCAVGPGDPFLTHFQALAAELEMAIAITYLERWEGLPRNTVSLIDRQGAIVLTYAKIHTTDFKPEIDGACTPGDDFYVATLDTAQGPVQVGAMICYDREFPESARSLMVKGAEIILTPNACPLEANRLGQYRTRAFENAVGMAMANYAAPEYNGHSIAFDGVAFRRSHGGRLDRTSRDMLLVEAGETEGVYMAPFDLDLMRDYRAHAVWGNAYRKPGCYGALVADAVREPFVRQDARR